jgi:hypothetical protein
MYIGGRTSRVAIPQTESQDKQEVDMRAKSILIVGIALFAASCATLASKPGQGAAAPGITQPQGDSGGQGIGSQQQGPSLNGDMTDPQDLSISPDGASDDRATGVKVDAVRLVGGQLFWGAP